MQVYLCLRFYVIASGRGGLQNQCGACAGLCRLKRGKFRLPRRFQLWLVWLLDWPVGQVLSLQNRLPILDVRPGGFRGPSGSGNCCRNTPPFVRRVDEYSLKNGIFSISQFSLWISDCCCAAFTQSLRYLSRFILPSMKPPSIPSRVPLIMVTLL